MAAPNHSAAANKGNYFLWVEEQSGKRREGEEKKEKPFHGLSVRSRWDPTKKAATLEERRVPPFMDDDVRQA